MVAKAQLAERERELAKRERELKAKALELDRREEALKGALQESAITAFLESNPQASFPRCPT